MSKWSDLQSVVKSDAPGQALTVHQRAADAVAAALPKLPSRKEVVKFEAFLRSLPQTPLAVQHHFADGVYVRVLPRPAGTITVGKTHRKSHVFIVHTGEVTMLTDSGMRRIAAPHAEVAAAGIKKIVVCHKDAVIMTVHENPNNWGESDLTKLEAELTQPDTALEGDFAVVES